MSGRHTPVYISVTSEQARTIFKFAASQIPASTKWVHHGRDPSLGLDCWGLIFAAYKNADMPIDEIDVPYGERDAHRAGRSALMQERLEKKFVKLGPHKLTGPFEKFPLIEDPWQCWSGDVLVVGTASLNHVALCIDGVVAEVTKDRVQCKPLKLVWPFVSAIYRHRKVLGV